QTDWALILPAIHVSGILILLWRYGFPGTRRSLLLFLILNGWLAALAVLYAYGNVEFAIALTADLMLRVVILGCWCIAGLGLPYVLWWCWRYRRSPRPRFTIGRWWFSTVLLLLAAEPLMSLIDRDYESIAFPEQLSDPPEGELRIALIGSSTMYGHPYEPKF